MEDRDNEICLDCGSTRWIHVHAKGLVYGTCKRFRGEHEEDILDNEPDFDFAEFKAHCEENLVMAGSVDVEFILWLYRAD